MIIKIGLTRHLQLAIAPAWFGGDDTTPGATAFIEATLALKWQVAENVPLLAAFAVQPSVTLPGESAADGTEPGATSVALVLISSHTIRGVSLDVDVGGTVSGASPAIPRTASLWAVSGGIPLAPRVTWGVELFGYPGTAGQAGEPPVVGFLTGPSVRLTKRLVIDGSAAIVGVKGFGSPAFFAGLTWNAVRLWTPSPAGAIEHHR